MTLPAMRQALIWRALAGLLLALLSGCAPARVTLPPAGATANPSTAKPAPSVTPMPTRAPDPLPTLTPAPSATPTLAALDFYEPAGCRRPPDEAGEVIEVNGWLLNRRTLAMLETAGELYGGPIDLTGSAVTQGSYHDNGSLSFGTHLGGGAVDLSIFLPGTWQVDFANLPRLVHALRAAGFAAWVRAIDEVYPGSGYHIHAIAVGDPQLSAEAEAQLTGTYGYFRGFDGLPREDGIPRADRDGGPLLCEWMRELGYNDLRAEAHPRPVTLWAQSLAQAAERYIAAPGRPVEVLAHSLYTTPQGLDQALAWALWRDAGLLPVYPNPANSLRAFLRYPTGPDTFWQVFPPEVYGHTRFEGRASGYDFQADPLLPGDLLGVTLDGRALLLVVTRVDDGGHAYAPLLVNGAEGWQVELALLYNPAETGAGLLEQVTGGFDRLRLNGLALPPGSTFEYTVQPGDTLPELATRFRSGVEAIRRANPSAQAGRLAVGERLSIPVVEPLKDHP